MNDRSNVILPVDYPQITSWQWHATLFTILGNEEVALNWIYSNYIQLKGFSITSNNFLFVDFMPGGPLMECPYLLTEIITRNQILYYFNDLLEFLLKSLDLSFYIYGICDETEILNRGNNTRTLHELFIYGYDLDKQVFYVGDFTFTGKYSYTTVSFDKVLNGFLNVKQGEDSIFNDNYSGICGLTLISKNLQSKYYDFDCKFVKQTINEYLNGCETKDHFRKRSNPLETSFYGVNTYDAIINRITLLELKVTTWYDYRPFHILYDHKVLMKTRLEYMMDNKYIPFNQDIIDKYDMVLKKVLVARNSFIRANVTRDITSLSRIKLHLLEAKQKEIDILSLVENQI